MVTIRKINEEIFVRREHPKNSTDIIWKINKVTRDYRGMKFSYGHLSFKDIVFPPEYIGKKIRIKIEVIN